MNHNGEPSSHEPDTFVSNMPSRSLPISGWRWKLAEIPTRSSALAEYAVDFDDSDWNTIRPKADGDTGETFLRDWQTAVFRAHIQLTEEELKNPGVQLRFAGIDDEGWIYVNGRRVGESSDWQDSSCFDVKQAMHPGDNVIAVGVRNYDGTGGIKSDVSVELVSRSVGKAWSRSLFNGLAQIIVQASRDEGEIKLTAGAEGLQSATAIIQTVSGPSRFRLP